MDIELYYYWLGYYDITIGIIVGGLTSSSSSFMAKKSEIE